MSQVFNTCLIDVYNSVVQANTSDQEEEQSSDWEAANPVTLYIYIFQLVYRTKMASV